MRLFPPINSNVEGTENINACYGEINALFNAIEWIKSSSWTERDVTVLACDIIMYSKGAARPPKGRRQAGPEPW